LTYLALYKSKIFKIMKQKKLKKLVLQKKSISNLNQNNLRGGDGTFTCFCPTASLCPTWATCPTYNTCACRFRTLLEENN